MSEPVIPSEVATRLREAWALVEETERAALSPYAPNVHEAMEVLYAAARRLPEAADFIDALKAENVGLRTALAAATERAAKAEAALAAVPVAHIVAGNWETVARDASLRAANARAIAADIARVAPAPGEPRGEGA